ncbi:helix-turn-helix domain-containing protein [uncultured Streptomyces sp.]|uniref:helix-turn-helix domain-containing protein n=1 Tax=uncultured Streptomyces sp. TaxID=174707 RepID=UPI00260F881D|nr:helix-turn-helix domain-containing protein [uncultured Streptomyces sp.]
MSLVLTRGAEPEGDGTVSDGRALGRALVPMTVVPHGGGPFEGRVTGGRLGHLRVTTVEAGPLRASRTARHLALPAGERPPGGEFVAVGVQTSGSVTLVQDGRRSVAGPGDLVVYDTARPFSLDYPERFSTHVVHVPHRTLALPDGDARLVTGTVAGFGAALTPFLTASTGAGQAVAGRIAAGLVDLLVTVAAERTRLAESARDGEADPLVARVRDHIDRHLADPALSPEAVARAHHISVRYLHRLFEGEDTTVRKLIQRRRLEECARVLARGGRTAPTVASVAQRWGFVNPAHFSRAFRDAYGVSPREWRTLRGTDSGTDTNLLAGGDPGTNGDPHSGGAPEPTAPGAVVATH